MSLCVAGASASFRIAAAAFTLAWTHSVERVRWEEDWRVTPAGLEIVEARIRGSGAGMEPPDGAVLADGWWRYRPPLAPLPMLVLGDSGVTGAWSLCTLEGCRDLPRGEPLQLRPCR